MQTRRIPRPHIIIPTILFLIYLITNHFYLQTYIYNPTLALRIYLVGFFICGLLSGTLLLLYELKFAHTRQANLIGALIFWSFALSNIPSVVKNLMDLINAINYANSTTPIFVWFIANCIMLFQTILFAIVASNLQKNNLTRRQITNITLFAIALSFVRDLIQILTLGSSNITVATIILTILFQAISTISSNLHHIIALFLFGLDHKIPAFKEVAITIRNPEKALRYWEEKRAAGEISEEEFQKQRAAIIEKL